MEKQINSYSSPFNFGHKALDDLFDGTVVVQEKVDGSQISFGTISGVLYVRSRKVMIDLNDPQMFSEAVESIKKLSLRDGYIYRGEYLAKPKHNTIKYDRIPRNNIILFDVDRGNQDYMSYEELIEEAALIDLEVVPQYDVYVNSKPPLDLLKSYLENTSILGGAKIEGVVLKNYDKYDDGKKVLMAKYVSTEFKEKHTDDWKSRNPSANDIIDILIDTYRTDARWRKAIQHLKESGKIEGVVQDIPVLMKEVSLDVLSECEEEIKEVLFKHFWKAISKGITRGLPEFYKSYLIEEALE